MRPLSPRRPITGILGTRQPWQHAYSDIDSNGEPHIGHFKSRIFGKFLNIFAFRDYLGVVSRSHKATVLHVHQCSNFLYKSAIATILSVRSEQ